MIEKFNEMTEHSYRAEQGLLGCRVCCKCVQLMTGSVPRKRLMIQYQPGRRLLTFGSRSRCWFWFWFGLCSSLQRLPISCEGAAASLVGTLLDHRLPIVTCKRAAVFCHASVFCPATVFCHAPVFCQCQCIVMRQRSVMLQAAAGNRREPYNCELRIARKGRQYPYVYKPSWYCCKAKPTGTFTWCR